MASKKRSAKPLPTAARKSIPAATAKVNALVVLLLAFFLPILLLLLVYRHQGMYPFGEKSLLIMDLNGQSVDFYAYIRGILTDGNSLVYSFQKGLGGNVIGLLNYYGAFPLSLLTALFPPTKMTEAVLLINLLKVGLAGLSMSILLRYLWKRWDLLSVPLAVAYGLMTYNVIYSMQFQWLSSVVLLPLVILGLHRLLTDGKWGVFTLFYVALLIFNIYTAFMVTVFTGLYVLWFFISRPETEEKGKKLGIYAASGVLGAAISAVWILPGFLAIQAGRGDLVPFEPEGNVTYNIGNIYQKLFIGQYDSITNTVKESAGTPSVFASMLVLLCVIFYFLSKKISLREKLASGGILVLFALSMAFVPLDKMWHIFSYPNWFPCRWAFIAVFFGVLLAGRFLGEGEFSEASMWLWGGMGGIFLVLLLVYSSHRGEFAYPKLAILSLALILIYALLLFAAGKAPKVMACALIGVVSVEVALAGAATVTGLDGQFHYKNRADYVTAVEKTGKAVSTIRELDSSPFYRVEKTYLRSDNDAMNAGYMGLTHYSSSFDKSFNDLDKALGMVQEWYACRYQGGTPVVDAVFGIKYLISDFAPADSYPLCAESVYENPNAFPLGFVAQGTLSPEIEFTGSYIENQNRFFESLTGKRVFTGTQAEAGADGIAYTLTVTDAKPLYMALPQKVAGNRIRVLAGGEEFSPRDDQETKVKLLGTFPVGTHVEVQLSQGSSAEFGYLEENVLTEAAQTAREEGLTVEYFGESKILAKANLTEGGRMVTTIPYDKGWKVTVNGKQAETQVTANNLLSFEVESGEAEIVFTYHAPGLFAGGIISALALVGVLVYAIIRKKKVQ